MLPFSCKSFVAIVVLLVANTSFGSFAADEGEAIDAPHVVIILLDDLGYGDLGCFNEDSRIETPHMDQLAKGGMRFLDAHAPGPLCHLSRYGLMTGRYPFRTNTGKWSREPVIAEERVTIAKMLQSQGYHTQMVGKWHLGFAENGYDNPLPGGPVDRGFDGYFGIRASTDIPPYFYIRDRQAIAPPTDQIEARNTEGWSNIQGEFWRAGGIAPGLELEDVLPRFTEEAERVIHDHAANKGDERLFLYLAYPAPHTPWLPAEEFRGRSEVPLYGDFTMMVDHMVGRVLKALDESEMADETLVILTSDNGPVWYETDVERFSHDSSGPWRGMKSDAWEAGHRMPFIVRWPDVVAPATSTSQTISFTDIMSTLADVLDVDLPEHAGPDSTSFLPVLRGEQDENDPIRGPIVLRSGGGMMTIRSGSWKLIQALGSGGFSQPRRIQPEEGDPIGQLYNLDLDPGETKNLYNDEPEIVARLINEMAEIVANDPEIEEQD